MQIKDAVVEAHMGLEGADGELREQTLSKSHGSNITYLQLHLPGEQPKHYKMSVNTHACA